MCLSSSFFFEGAFRKSRYVCHLRFCLKGGPFGNLDVLVIFILFGGRGSVGNLDAFVTFMLTQVAQTTKAELESPAD